jgi:hypothetical protein
MSQLAALGGKPVIRSSFAAITLSCSLFFAACAHESAAPVSAATAEPSPTSGTGPVVTTGDVEMRGSLDRAVVEQAVESHFNEVRACYASGLDADPRLSGQVSVSFIISATGALQTAMVRSNTLVSSTGAGESVAECILGRVRTWTFPPPEGGGIVGVNYPFVLSPSP